MHAILIPIDLPSLFLFIGTVVKLSTFNVSSYFKESKVVTLSLYMTLDCTVSPLYFTISSTRATTVQKYLWNEFNFFTSKSIFFLIYLSHFSICKRKYISVILEFLEVLFLLHMLFEHRRCVIAILW